MFFEHVEKLKVFELKGGLFCSFSELFGARGPPEELAGDSVEHFLHRGYPREALVEALFEKAPPKDASEKLWWS